MLSVLAAEELMLGRQQWRLNGFRVQQAIPGNSISPKLDSVNHTHVTRTMLIVLSRSGPFTKGT
jgi:hypothetical protein